MLPSPAKRRSPRLLWWSTASSLIVLLACLAGFFVLLYRDWYDEQRDGLVQELLWLEQSLRLHLDGLGNGGAMLSVDIAAARLDARRFGVNARALRKENPELDEVQWVEEGGRVTAALQREAVGQQLAGERGDALWRASRTLRPAFGQPYRGDDGRYRFDLVVPVVRDGHYDGGVRLVIALEDLLQEQVPWWIASKYHISVVDLGGKTLVSRFNEGEPLGLFSHQIGFEPPGFGLALRAVSYRSGIGVTLPALLALIVLMSAALLYSLWRVRAHTRERLSAERALQAEMEWRQAIEDSMKSGLIAFDPYGRITRVNRAFCDMTGLPAAALLGQLPPHAFWPQGERARLEQVMAAVLEGRLPEHGFELTFERSDGEPFQVRLYATPLLGGGEQQGWIASLYDITELRRQRLALAASRERFLAVLNGLQTGVCVTDSQEHGLLYANPACWALWGMEDPGAAWCPLLSVRGELSDGQYHEVGPDADGRHLQLLQRRIDWGLEHDARLTLLVDISALRQREERERAQEERIQSTARLIAVGEVASSLAHDLNQPLTAINTYAAGLRRRLHGRDDLPAGSQDALLALSEQARRAGQIVNSIRAFVKRHEPQLHSADPSGVLRRALALATTLADKQGVTLTLDDAWQGGALNMDPVLVEQVLLNLVRNAVEALSAARVRHPAVRVSTAADGDGWRVTVHDNGPGLPPEVRQRLFTPFYSTKPDGMGIGLNICRSIVEFHGGVFGVDTEEGGGSTFWFRLPGPGASQRA